MYTHSQIFCHKNTLKFHYSELPLYNVELILYSSALFAAWLIIASILLHLELSMQGRLSLLSCSGYLGGHLQEGAWTQLNFRIEKYPKVHTCHSEGLETAQGRWEPSKAASKIPTAQCFPWCLPAGVAHSSLDSLQDTTNP